MTRLSVVGDNGEENRVGRPSGSFDPWDTEKGHEYDPDKFYTRSTNKHDHSIDVRFRFPPQLAAMVSEIVDSKKFPQLRSIADFYRDAAVHRLQHLNEMIQDGKYDRSLNSEMRLARAIQNKEEVEAMQARVNAHETSLEIAAQVGDREVLASALSFVEDDILTIRQPYKAQLQSLAKKHREWLKRAPVEDDE